MVLLKLLLLIYKVQAQMLFERSTILRCLFYDVDEELNQMTLIQYISAPLQVHTVESFGRRQKQILHLKFVILFELNFLLMDKNYSFRLKNNQVPSLLYTFKLYSFLFELNFLLTKNYSMRLKNNQVASLLYTFKLYSQVLFERSHY